MKLHTHDEADGQTWTIYERVYLMGEM